ncbi:FixJ family two-component response regulator [Novosphingobium chloroacetimidivorans]|uniref:FixJ family two-component response regulator n=1 Tax=Novosphingobium chloroacetimidivorans TaxID=1428314 RepID=A0A7W7KFE3_9SPHN|nr:LuxR C-terminal-related transcriptional regulator [Novosphingobium chloroacetimidivorans]MBB4861063.1 FixJ family two-component response regulator [Novosphingobium chloroacetimidivorans]
MKRPSKLILIDHSARRRAAITHALSATHLHVEPFETLDELTIAWPRLTGVLLHDRGGSVATLVKVMTEQGRSHPIVAYHENPRLRHVVDAVLAGAVDYLGWPFVAEELTAALARMAEKAEEPDKSGSRAVAALSNLSRLTKRELEVLDRLSRGLTNQIIADELAISRRTVETYRANLLIKLGVSNTAEAVQVAIEAALKR